jgi:hypothetical protein
MEIFNTVNAIIISILFILLLILIQTDHSDFASDNFNFFFLFVVAFLFICYDIYQIYLTYELKEITPDYLPRRIFYFVHSIIVILLAFYIYYLRMRNPSSFTFLVFASFIGICSFIYFYPIGYLIYNSV